MSRIHVQKHHSHLVLTSEGKCIYVTGALCTGLVEVPISSEWAVNRSVYDIIDPDNWKHIHFIWNVDTELDTIMTLYEIRTNAQSNNTNISNTYL